MAKPKRTRTPRDSTRNDRKGTRPPAHRAAEEAVPAGGVPDAVEPLQVFVKAVNSLLERDRNGVSLLDLRRGEEQVGVRPAPLAATRDWNAGILRILAAGQALDAALSVTKAASAHRRDLHALVDAFRLEENLRAVPAAWPRIRDGLDCFVRGVVGEAVTGESGRLDGALVACGLRPLAEPEPSPLGAALRAVLRTLLFDAASEEPKRIVRAALDHASSRGPTPRLARFALARGLSERPPLLPRAQSRVADLERRAFLAPADPRHPPRLPARLAGAALLLLASLDVAEAREGRRVSWRGRSAYNVLRNVAGEARWSPELRAVIEGVLDRSLVDEEETARRALRVAVGSAGRRAVRPVAGRPVVAANAPAATAAPRKAVRVLLSETEERVYMFLASSFQKGRRPTYDDAMDEGWTRETYSKALKALEKHGILERHKGKPVRVFERDSAR